MSKKVTVKESKQYEVLNLLEEKYKSSFDQKPYVIFTFTYGRIVDGILINYYFSSDLISSPGYYKNNELKRKAENKYDLEVLYEALTYALLNIHNKDYLFSSFVFVIKCIIKCIQESKQYFSYQKYLDNHTIDDKIKVEMKELLFITMHPFYQDTINQLPTTQSSHFAPTHSRRKLFYAILYTLRFKSTRKR